MAFIKCPRCDLNYILDGESLCVVCRREVKGESEPVDIADLCSECGENPVLPGEELCLFCLKELHRGVSIAGEEVIIAPEGAAIEIDSVSAMDEIVLDTVDPAFSSDDDFVKDDEKDETADIHEGEDDDDAVDDDYEE